jgi:threonine/homoserine/homoserine lactone efflux protein
MVGCVVGVGGAVALFMLLADLLPSQDSGGSSLVASVIKMVVGVLLVVLALRQWRGRPAGGDQAELPNWMAGVDSMTPGKALVLGLLLSAVVPKNLLLALSAGLIVGEAGFSGGQAAVVIVLFTAIATSTVAVPVVAHLVASAQVHRRLWLSRPPSVRVTTLPVACGVVIVGRVVGPRCQERSQIYLRRPGVLHHSACAAWNSCLAPFSLRATGSDLAPRRSRPARRPRVAPAQATDWHSSGHVDPSSCVAVRWWREPSPSSGRTRPG